MKLYYSIAPDAGPWQLPGKQDKGAARVDVPDKAAELVAWLNARRVGRVPYDPQLANKHELERLEPSYTSPPARLDDPPGACPKCHRTAVGALGLRLQRELEEIEAWLEDLGPDQLDIMRRAVELIRARVRAIGARVDEGGTA